MKNHENKIYSQNGEDGIIQHIFNHIDTTNKIAVEIGVSAGGSGLETNTRLLADHNWKLYWFDCEETTNLPSNCTFIKEFLTKDNVVSLFEKNNIPKYFDLLSIDIDGNDYHIREALSNYKPRVCIMEYNGNYPSHLEYVMPYNENYSWKLWETNFGASLKSLTIQAQALGYDLVYCDSRGVNAFFVQHDINVFKNLSPDEAYVKLWWAK